MADTGSSSSVSGGLNMERERLQSKNDYSYLGEDSQTRPLEDLGNRLMDQYNQGNAQSNLLFGGPGYGGSFQPRGGAPPTGGGGAPPPGGGTPPPGGGSPPPGGGGTPPVVHPPAQPLPGSPGTPVVPKNGGGVSAPGGPPVNAGGGGAFSDAQLAELQKSIPSARRLPNGKITWDGRVRSGVDEGEDPQTTTARLNQIQNGNLSPNGGGTPSGNTLPYPALQQQPPAQQPPLTGVTPRTGVTATPGQQMSVGAEATPGQQANAVAGTPSAADMAAMFPGLDPGVGTSIDQTVGGLEAYPGTLPPSLMAASGPENQNGLPPTGGGPPTGGPPNGGAPPGGSSGPGPATPGAPGQTYSPPYAAGMDPRYGKWNPVTGAYDMSAGTGMQDQSKFPVHDPNYNPLDPTWKYYTQQQGNTYTPLNPNQRNDEDMARTSPVTPQGSNINDAWSTSVPWRPEAPTGGLYGGYTDLTAAGPINPGEALQSAVSSGMATGQIGGVDDPTVRVLMNAWADQYNKPGYSDTAKAAIGQEGMLGARGAADANSANIMSMARRTNNPMAAYGALGDVSRGESQAFGSQARKNAIDFENEANRQKQEARTGYLATIDPALSRQQQGVGILGATNKQQLDRRMGGYSGLNDLYKNQQGQNNSLLQQLQSLYSTRREDNTQLGKTAGQGGFGT